MKRIISAVLCIAMVTAVLCGCVIQRQIPGAEDIKIVNSLARVQPTSDPALLNTAKLQITLAKNEKEGGQFILRSDSHVYTGLSASVSLLKSDDGSIIPASDIELFHLEYARFNGNRTNANIMLPLSDPDFNSLTSIQGENLVYYVRVSTYAETPAGVYSGTVTLTHNDGKMEIPLEVTVIDFTLPATPSLGTDMLYWSDFTKRWYGDEFTPEQIQEYFVDAVMKCRENKITVRTRYDEPIYSAYSTAQEYAAAMKKFLADNPTVTIYNIPIVWQEWMKTINTERTLPYINALRDEGILDRGLFNTIDEPHTPDEYETLREIGEWVLTYAPDLNHYVTTFPGQIDMDIVKPEYIKIWCSVYPLINLETMRDYQEQYGAKFWGYGFDKDSNQQITTIRAIGWELKKHNMVGLEDWCINSCTSYYSPETNWVLTDNDASLYAWFFPGKPGDNIVNKNVQVTTLTFENIRDAVEDYDYLIALENRFQQKIDELSLDITLDEAMESFYDGIFLDLHKLPQKNHEGFTKARELMIDGILNGVDFIMTTSQDPVKWVFDSRYITIYAAADSTVEINGTQLKKEDCGSYAKFSYYLEMSTDGADLTITVDGKSTACHLLCKEYKKGELFDLNDATILEKMRTANPTAGIDIIAKDGLKTLKLTFNKTTNRGIRFPVELLKTNMTGYSVLRTNIYSTESYDNLQVQFSVRNESTGSLSSMMPVPNEADLSTIITTGWDTKVIPSVIKNMTELHIITNKTIKDDSEYTIYLSNIYFIDESNNFQWIIW